MNHDVVMEDKPKKPQFLHVPAVVVVEEDNKCFNESSETDGDESVPLGLTSRAVCMQVRFSLSNHLNWILIRGAFERRSVCELGMIVSFILR